MSAPARPRVAILSSVHQALDNRVFYREARTLARAGFDVTLVAPHDHNETRDGVRIRALPRVARSHRPLLWRALGQLARETAADLYHFHDPELLLLSSWLRRATGRPTIYDIHEANADFIRVKDYLPGVVRAPLAGVFRRLEPRLATGESGLIFADDAIAADFTGFDGPTATLFNFPGAELIASGAAVATGREPVVLYLGGMERNRGAALMLEAFARVVAALPTARLLLVGHFMPPALEVEMRADAARRGIGHAVEFAGHVPFERIGDYLARARAGWVTWQAVAKNCKNIPTKLFEYMAYGLPVVSSDLPSTRPFVRPGENGLLAVAGDPAAHAAALLALLRDPAEAMRLGERGRQRVADEWNWAAMEPRLLALYAAVLGR